MQKNSKKVDYEIHMILLGDHSAGKTSLSKAYCLNQYTDEPDDPTLRISHFLI